MNRWLKRGLIGIGVLVGLAGGSVALLASKFSSDMNEVYDVRLPALAVPTSSAAITRGAHLALIGGCRECHGDDLGGKKMIDKPPIGRIVATNLTRGKNGVADKYGDAEWDRAIRNGLRHDARPLYFMPS